MIGLQSLPSSLPQKSENILDIVWQSEASISRGSLQQVST